MSVLPVFDIAEPQSAEEAVRLKAAHPAACFLAGGTDLVPNLRRGLHSPDLLISLARIPELQQFVATDDGLQVGAGVHLADIGESLPAGDAYRALGMAAASIAGPAHRTMATVGGNLCVDTRCVYYNQSSWWRAANGYCLKKDGDTCHVAKKGGKCVAAYSGDLAPALLVLGAEVEVVSVKGRRRLPLADMFREDGQACLNLDAAELIAAVHIPASTGLSSGYLKSRIRQSIDFPLAGVAAAMACSGASISRLAVAVTGTNSRPVLLEGLDTLLGEPLSSHVLDGLGKIISRSVQPMRTTLVPSLYRRHMAGVLARRLVTQLYENRAITQRRT
jgi:4-hydroxybenzoyl-CoA reductase subunit beta